MEETTQVQHKNLLDVFMNGFLNMFDYKSRASKYDYWGFILMHALVSILLGLLFTIGAAVISERVEKSVDTAYALVSGLAVISLVVRRLHDTGHSGLILLVPFVLFILSGLGYINNAIHSASGIFSFIAVLSALYILVLLLIKGTDGQNEYGEPVIEPENYNMYANLFFVTSLAVKILLIVLALFFQFSPKNFDFPNKPIPAVENKSAASADKSGIPAASADKFEIEESEAVEMPNVPMHGGAE
ncbi:MAG: DUF805 domain-containing protein [Pseudomonadota bacterium]|nr:DUF805 domain-containing protein [Pseudomonadota bacterium]